MLRRAAVLKRICDRRRAQNANRKPEPYNAFEYYCKIDPMYAQQYDECYRTNFLGEDLKDDESEDL